MKLMSTLHGCMTIGHFANIFTPNDARIPNITPIRPPVTLSNTASMRNWLRISIPRAPTDIRRPISLVRSVTDTYIIFIMPIPPTIKEIHATTKSKVVMRSLVEFIIVESSFWERIVKSSSYVPSSPFFILWLSRNRFEISSMASSVMSSVSAEAFIP